MLAGNAGVYIHVPFCARRCAYCDFYSTTARSVPPRFVGALERESRMASDRFDGLDVGTIYIGGGTPSLMDASGMERIIDAVRGSFNVSIDCELTVEVNPGTIDARKLDAYKRAGVNRLSVGVQAAQGRLLSTLGRIHGWDDAARTIDSARACGIDNLSVDLIYAIPGQSADDWRETLDKVVSLDARHVSCYELTLEPGTPMHARYEPVDESISLAMQDDAMRILSEAGIFRYEISNYAKPNYESRHNERYWMRRPYIGLGPGAHGCVGSERFANPSDLDGWLAKIESGKPAWIITETLTRSDAMFETMMLGLRMIKGVDIAAFQREYGAAPLELWESELNGMRRAGWADWDAERIWLTPRGLDVHNAVCLKLSG